MLADTDVTTATIVSVGMLAVPPAVAWRGFAEQELLERWYGPVEAPAEFECHELVPEARSLYRLGSGAAPARLGYLQFVVVEPAQRVVFVDGIRTADGAVSPEFLHATVEFETAGSGTRVIATQHFGDRNRMEQLMLDQFEAVVSRLT